MKSFRKQMLEQINAIPAGRIFTYRDIDHAPEKRPNLAVLLHELVKDDTLTKVEKGAYYRPKQSSLGFGARPLAFDEKIRYYTDKLQGYLSGPYIYNKMQLTEQVPMVVTIAVNRPVRNLHVPNVRVEQVKAYHRQITPDNLWHLRILDAIKDIKVIPGTKQQDVYDRLKSNHFARFAEADYATIQQLAFSYPPRVRKVLADIMEDMGQLARCCELDKSIRGYTGFKFKYKQINA